MMELTPEQAAALQQKKADYAAANAGECPDGTCTNPKCRCAHCTCGAKCTCNVSPEVNCDPCKAFKAEMMQKTSACNLAAAEDWYKQNLAQKFADAGVPGIRAAEVKKHISGESSPSVLLVDCRSEAERTVSTIPGAMAQSNFEKDVSVSAGKLVVPFCTVGGRSGACAVKLMASTEKPWADLKNFELSILDWCHSGGALVDAGGAPTTKVHSWSEQMAGMFPAAGFEVVWEPKP